MENDRILMATNPYNRELDENQAIQNFESEIAKQRLHVFSERHSQSLAFRNLYFLRNSLICMFS